MLLGLSAGLSPGPLLTLVVSETLRHDIKAGVKVAVAPIITDVPIIIATCFILSKLSGFHTILGIISLAGGCFILFMGYESLRSTEVACNTQERQPRSLIKGITASLLNPHPYLFWLSVGAPMMTRAMNINKIAPMAFICGFYTFLVGSKILLAIVVGKSKAFLNGAVYKYTLRFLGLALCVLAVVLFREGLKLLGLI